MSPSSVKSKHRKRGFGQVLQMRSGRYQARYTGPDGNRHTAPTTFDAKDDAIAWLRAERPLTEDPATWEPPKVRLTKSRDRLTFATFARRWVERRTLKPRTREHYTSILENHLIPAFGELSLTRIAPDTVTEWHAQMGSARPTLRAHAYGLLRTILSEAERDELITRNPCHIRGAGNSKRVHKIKPATLPELEALVAAMPERQQVMTLLAAWCGLRFGELAELRRKDVNLAAGQLHVRRAVARSNGQPIVGTPKSDAGHRDVAIPPHLVPLVEKHLTEHALPGKGGLLFPGRDGGHLTPSTLYGRKATKKRKGWGFYQARAAAGRDDLRWHDLRHTGAVLAAATGATLAELMGRLGHSTPGAALRYQHAAEGRDTEIARKLSALAGGLGDGG
ncbi:MAG: tyrosine-type recombinase/integrase [Marmoricola sp.]